MRSSLVCKLLCLVGAVGIAVGLMVAAMSAAAPAGRLAGANLALGGGMLLIVSHRLHQREEDGGRDEEVGASHFFDRSVSDQQFWPDGI